MSIPSNPRFRILQVGVNATVPVASQGIGGFLAITSGTVTINFADGAAAISAFPVTAGNWYFMPFYIGQNGGTVITAGGASGVLGLE